MGSHAVYMHYYAFRYNAITMYNTVHVVYVWMYSRYAASV
jgi:hypothetical protein